MDQWFSRWNSSSMRTFSERIPQLQTALKSWPRRFEKSAKPKLLNTPLRRFPGIEKIRAVGFCVFAVAMGIVAYNTCCEETSLAWLKSHFPSQIIWQASLSTEGLRLIKDPKMLAKALKNLPARVESGNQVWEGKLVDGPSWWVVYPGKGQDDPLIFCRTCDQIPKKWQPAGEGWSALEAVLAQVRANVPTFIAKRELKRTEVLDPREIRY
jgi:hypothetical protein